MLVKTTGNQETAAAKAGMDAKTARKYRRLGKLPSELPAAPRWRNRPDPFIEVWGEICELLEINAGLEAKTVFEFLQRRSPGEFAGRAVAHVAAAGEGLAGDRGSGQGGVLRAATSARPAGSVGLHPYGRAGRDDPRTELSAPDLSLRADVLELGSGNGVLFGELREPERRTAERAYGNWARFRSGIGPIGYRRRSTTRAIRPSSRSATRA